MSAVNIPATEKFGDLYPIPSWFPIFLGDRFMSLTIGPTSTALRILPKGTSFALNQKCLDESGAAKVHQHVIDAPAYFVYAKQVANPCHSRECG